LPPPQAKDALTSAEQSAIAAGRHTLFGGALVGFSRRKPIDHPFRIGFKHPMRKDDSKGRAKIWRGIGYSETLSVVGCGRSMLICSKAEQPPRGY
jgi:hypothetical protein